MLTYSARKKSANFSELVLGHGSRRPARDSASGRSNGARLVSPTAEMKKMTKLGQQQDRVPAGRRDARRRRCCSWRAVAPARRRSRWCDIVPAVMNTATMRQAHRDLVRDHLGAGAQAAQQRVGRAGGPAAEHDAVDAHRRAGQHHQHRHRHVGELQRRLVAEDRSPSGRTGSPTSAVNAQIVEMTGAKKKTTLSAARGMMSSLNASFRPSASDCSRPNGPTWLGPGRTCIRATTRRSNQIAEAASCTTRKTKTTTILMRTSHQGSLPKSASVGSCARTERSRRHLRCRHRP